MLFIIREKVNRNIASILIGLFCFILLFAVTSPVLANERLLSWGSRGSDVSILQRDLTNLGYNTYGVDGVFGKNTYNAVVRFQQDKKIIVDGIVGSKTRMVINYAKNGSNQIPSRSVSNRPEMADWWSVVNYAFPRGIVATVRDIDTGISYQIKRLGGSSHADVEPLTDSDTIKMKQIYGGNWSWTRRAVVVTVNGRSFAGSQNAMPHGGQAIYNNNFSGHFCIHFLNSRTHSSNSLDFTHQNMLRKAAGI